MGWVVSYVGNDPAVAAHDASVLAYASSGTEDLIRRWRACSLSESCSLSRDSRCPLYQSL